MRMRLVQLRGFYLGLILVLSGPIAVVGQAQTQCWAGTFKYNWDSEHGDLAVSGNLSIVFDSPQWPAELAGDRPAFGGLKYNQRIDGCHPVNRPLVGEIPCPPPTSSGAGRVKLFKGDNDEMTLLVGMDYGKGSDFGDADLGSSGVWWRNAQVTDSEITSNVQFYAQGGELHLRRTNCNGNANTRPAQQQTYTQPKVPPHPRPDETADQVLSRADEILAAADRLSASPGGNPLPRASPSPSQKRSLTFVSFANHNGLYPDATWGVCTGSNQNEAEDCALRSCTSKLPQMGDQCGSNGKCVLIAGTWAAYAISTTPFLSSDGPYPSGSSCGLPSQAAAKAQALNNCQASQTSCQVVWSDSGK